MRIAAGIWRRPGDSVKERIVADVANITYDFNRFDRRTRNETDPLYTDRFRAHPGDCGMRGTT
jgi:hypothetical protein